MTNLTVSSKQNFMGNEIPVILGGFGEGKRSMSDKTIAEIHGMEIKHVRELINRNAKRFHENVDLIDLKEVVQDDHNIFSGLGYTTMQISKSEHIYLLSERGYSKLIKIMDTDLAWEVHDKIMDEYFQMREEKKEIKNLSPQLQLLINMELEQQRQAQELIEIKGQAQRVSDRVESIREVVALNPNDWRKDSVSIINAVALELGGYEHIKVIRNEIYHLLEQRMGVSLSTRLTNRKKTIALNGLSKSKIDKLNYLDVISYDKKLIEGYIAIVKEIAVKYGYQMRAK